MSTASPLSEAHLRLIDQRLDAIDRALLGLVPRNERLPLVAKLETRIRELAAQDPAFEAQLGTADESPALSGAAASVAAAEGRTASTSKKRSRLALASGVVGIVALSLLCITPFAYLLIVNLAEALGEIVTSVSMIAYLLAIGVGGTLAVAFGIAGLVSLARHARSLVGHGWAITGLCTGPLPMFVGGLLLLLVGIPTLASMPVGSNTSVCNQTVATCVPYTPPTDVVGYATGVPPMYVPGQTGPGPAYPAFHPYSNVTAYSDPATVQPVPSVHSAPLRDAALSPSIPPAPALPASPRPLTAPSAAY